MQRITWALLIIHLIFITVLALYTRNDLIQPLHKSSSEFAESGAFLIERYQFITLVHSKISKKISIFVK